MVKTQKRPKSRRTAKRARPAKRIGAKPVTRLGAGGYGARRSGSFEGKEIAPAPAARYAELLEGIAALDKQLSELPAPPPGIGHNQPPPLNAEEIDEIKRDLAMLKAQSPTPPEVKVAESRFRDRAQQVVTFFAKEGVREIVRAGVKEVVAWASDWAKVAQRLEQIANLIRELWNSIF